MPRLVINPGTASERELKLATGRNTLGRGLANDHRIDDGSVSTLHCQITVEDGSVIVTDLSSTNGTFVENAPVSEAVLLSGQTLRLGSVPMLFEDEYVRLPPDPDVGIRRAEPETHKGQAPSAGPCKHHPKTRGRYFCQACAQFYCELCVGSRHGGPGLAKTCRHCGGGCVETALRYEQPVERGFFERLPGGFLYPFRGAGVFVVVVGMVLLALLRAGALLMAFGTMRAIAFGIILQIFAGGYLFTFLQAIIHATAAEDKELPELPGISNFLDDVILPFLRGLGLILFCFGPSLILGIWLLSGGAPGTVRPLFLAMLVFGLVYFPMAFLAVAVLDAVTAANPLVVVTSIVKVPGRYLVVLLMLGAVSGFRALGDILLPIVFPDGLRTTSVPLLFAYLGAQLLWGFASLYLLVAGTHILGLLYLTSKRKLGWLER